MIVFRSEMGDAMSDVMRLPSSPADMIPPTSPGAPLSNAPSYVHELDLSSPLNYGTPSSNLSSVRTPMSGIRGTPIRHRSDIRNDKRMRQVNVASDAPVCI